MNLIQNVTGKNYVYMNNLDDNTSMESINMGMDMTTDVIAQGFTHKVLTNFTTGCYAKDVDFNLTTNLEDNNRAKLGIVSYNDDNTTNLIIQDTNSTLHIPATEFLDVNEGNSSFRIRYNIGREANQTRNPIEVKFERYDAKSDYFDDSKPKVKDTDDYNTSSGINLSEIFYYARVSSYVENYPPTDKTSILTPLFVEVYCQTNTPTQDWCRDIIKPTMISNGQKTYKGWYLNTEHDTTAGEGQVTGLGVNITTSCNGSGLGINTNYNPANMNFVNGKINNIQTSLNGSLGKEEIKAKIDIVTSPWLRYNKKSINNNAYYNVTFKPSGDLTGISKNGNGTSIGYNLMRDQNGNLNGMVEKSGKMSW